MIHTVLMNMRHINMQFLRGRTPSHKQTQALALTRQCLLRKSLHACNKSPFCMLTSACAALSKGQQHTHAFCFVTRTSGRCSCQTIQRSSSEEPCRLSRHARPLFHYFDDTQRRADSSACPRQWAECVQQHKDARLQRVAG